MAHISWRDEYSVNVALIDEQHKHFLVILDEVYDSFSSKHSAIEIGGIIEKLFEHVDLHFGTEERYFDQFHCDDIAEEEHRHQHALFRENVAELKRRYDEGQTDLVTELALADLMENHLIQHIMVYDKQYSECFNAHGLH